MVEVVSEGMPEKAPDILTIVLFRYFLEEATRLSLEKLIQRGQAKEVSDLFEPATRGNVTGDQLEYVLLYYSQNPEGLRNDIDNTLNTIRHMMRKALEGE